MSRSLSLALPILLDPSNDVLGPLNGLNPPLADDAFLQVSFPSFDVFFSGFFGICHKNIKIHGLKEFSGGLKKRRKEVTS